MFFGFLILLGVFIGVLIATIVVVVMHMRTTTQLNKMTFPAYEYAIKKAEHEAQALIQEAQKTARDITAQAEQTGQQTIDEYTQQAKHIHTKYVDTIALQTKEITDALHSVQASQTQAMTSVVSFAEDAITSQQTLLSESVKKTNQKITHTAEVLEKEAQKVVKDFYTRIDTVAQKFEKKLEEVDKVGQNHLKSHILSLQNAADEHIKEYQKSREDLLDAHIEQLVEKIVIQVLHTQLPTSAHASLARTALEDAKAKHIL